MPVILYRKFQDPQKPLINPKLNPITQINPMILTNLNYPIKTQLEIFMTVSWAKLIPPNKITSKVSLSKTKKKHLKAKSSLKKNFIKDSNKIINKKKLQYQ